MAQTRKTCLLTGNSRNADLPRSLCEKARRYVPTENRATNGKKREGRKNPGNFLELSLKRSTLHQTPFSAMSNAVEGVAMTRRSSKLSLVPTHASLASVPIPCGFYRIESRTDTFHQRGHFLPCHIETNKAHLEGDDKSGDFVRDQGGTDRPMPCVGGQALAEETPSRVP